VTVNVGANNAPLGADAVRMLERQLHRGGGTTSTDVDCQAWPTCASTAYCAWQGTLSPEPFDSRPGSARLTLRQGVWYAPALNGWFELQRLHVQRARLDPALMRRQQRDVQRRARLTA
jgi:hypothetical protein